MREARYEVPQYLPERGATWFHVLYGHVPAYQQDFIYRPVTPFDKLLPNHYGDLQPLVRDLRPAPGRAFAFAFGNLSAGDTRHQAGRGGLALVVGVRVQDARDHAGREQPVFVHGVCLVDQPLDADFLARSARALVERFIDEQEGPSWYRRYVSAAEPTSKALQQAYVDRFSLPAPPPEGSPRRWRLAGARLPFNRLLIQRDPEVPFERVLLVASRLASLLYHSRLRWISISDAQLEARQQLYAAAATDLYVRFVPPASVTPDEHTRTLGLDEVPEEEDALAELLGLTDRRTAGMAVVELAAPEPEPPPPEPEPTQLLSEEATEVVVEARAPRLEAEPTQLLSAAHPRPAQPPAAVVLSAAAPVAPVPGIIPPPVPAAGTIPPPPPVSWRLPTILSSLVGMALVALLVRQSGVLDGDDPYLRLGATPQDLAPRMAVPPPPVRFEPPPPLPVPQPRAAGEGASPPPPVRPREPERLVVKNPPKPLKELSAYQDDARRLFRQAACYEGRSEPEVQERMEMLTTLHAVITQATFISRDGSGQVTFYKEGQPHLGADARMKALFNELKRSGPCEGAAAAPLPSPPPLPASADLGG